MSQSNSRSSSRRSSPSSSSSSSELSSTTSSASQPLSDEPEQPKPEQFNTSEDVTVEFNEELDCMFGKGKWYHLAWYHPSYVVDYLALIVVALITNFAIGELDPHEVIIPNEMQNEQVSFPNNSSIVPTFTLVFYCFLFPLLVGVLTATWKKSLHDFHNMALGFFSAVVTVFLIVETIKVAAGRPRPHFLASGDTPDSRKSFPSGHSATAFVTMGYLATYLAGKLHIFSNWSQDSPYPFQKKPEKNSLAVHHRKAREKSWKDIFIYLIKYSSTYVLSLIALAPLAMAFWIAVSRVVDYHHNYDDILAGGILGGFMSVYYYHIHFHPLFSPLSHLPRKRWELADGYQKS